MNDFLVNLYRTWVRNPNTPLMNKVNKSYLKWLEAVNENRILRIKLNERCLLQGNKNPNGIFYAKDNK